MKNIISDSLNGTHFIIDTPEGRGVIEGRGPFSWVISERDLLTHTPWSREDLETVTDDEMQSFVFPKGVKGFFIV